MGEGAEARYASDTKVPAAESAAHSQSAWLKLVMKVGWDV